jgi:hypothetical protein
MREHMDNFRVDVTARTDEALRLTLDLVMADRGRVLGYRVGEAAGAPTLILYQYESKKMIPLPPMGIEAASHFIRAWLADATYPPEPDIDGSVKKAWQIYNEDWGHVQGEFEAFMAVRPVWALIGK